MMEDCSNSMAPMWVTVVWLFASGILFIALVDFGRKVFKFKLFLSKDLELKKRWVEAAAKEDHEALMLLMEEMQLNLNKFKEGR